MNIHPYFQLEETSLYLGDSLQVLQSFPSNYVQTIITGPPYYVARTFGQGAWEGGDSNCTHKLLSERSDDNHVQEGYRDKCERCGAVRSQYDVGRFLDREQYFTTLVNIFDAAKRVLRDDGVLWLSSGDAYSYGVDGMPTKNLFGVPWSLAIRLQSRGWILRSDVIWEEPSISLRSAPDRPTRSHDYLFMFVKTPRYYYNSMGAMERNSKDDGWRKLRTIWTFSGESYRSKGYDYPLLPQKLVARCIELSSHPGDTILDPFVGAASVPVVALQLNRKSIGIELSPKYIEIAKERIQSMIKVLEQKDNR